ncbi:MAG: putative OsmC-like protein [Halieaceae bacterium]|jgi:uncharacterized OsmC-like protein
MTLRMYAGSKSLPLEHVVVALRHFREYIEDCEGCEEKPRQIEVLERQVTLSGDLLEEQRQRLLQIADPCPVHRTLHATVEVRSVLSE